MGCTCGCGLAIATDMDVKQNGSIGVCLYTGKHKLLNFPNAVRIRLPLDVSTRPHIWLESIGALCCGWEEEE